MTPTGKLPRWWPVPFIALLLPAFGLGLKSVARGDMSVREVALWVGVAVPTAVVVIALLAFFKSQPRVGPLEPGAGRFLAGLGVFMVALWGAAVGGAAAGSLLAHDDPPPEIMPGYRSANTQNGRPLTVGAPWGPPCTPVVVFTGDGVDRQTLAAARLPSPEHANKAST